MRRRQGRARKAYHSDGRTIHPKLRNRRIPLTRCTKFTQIVQRSCRTSSKFAVAICNLKLVVPTLSAAEGEGSAARRKMQIPHFVRDDKVWGIGALESRVKGAASLPQAAIARRPPARSLPRRSWSGTFPYSRPSSKWFSLHPRKLS